MEVELRPVSRWQKRDCLFCFEDAVSEAVCGSGHVMAHVRCCTNPECIESAKKLAVKLYEDLAEGSSKD